MSASDIALVVSLKAFSSSLRFKQAALGLRLRSVKQKNGIHNYNNNRNNDNNNSSTHLCY